MMRCHSNGKGCREMSLNGSAIISNAPRIKVGGVRTAGRGRSYAEIGRSATCLCGLMLKPLGDLVRKHVAAAGFGFCRQFDVLFCPSLL